VTWSAASEQRQKLSVYREASMEEVEVEEEEWKVRQIE
jgi:hypothetical protein